METLKDLKDIPEYTYFSGTVIYRKQIEIEDPLPAYLNIGQVYGVAEVKINGESCGVKWYGNRIFPVAGFLKSGVNELEIHVITERNGQLHEVSDR